MGFHGISRKDVEKYDLEYQRLKNGLDIGERSTKYINNEKKRIECKEKLQRKECTALEYINEISNTIGNPQFHNYSESTELEESNNEDSDGTSDEESLCNLLSVEIRHLLSYHVAMLKYVEIVNLILIPVIDVPYVVLL